MYQSFHFFISHYSLILANAWTVSSTSNPGRSVINGSFTGELDLPSQDNNEITNRVDQLEKEVKGRDAEIRELNDRVNIFFLFKLIILFYCSSFVV
jgi:hypothetical protein